MDNLESVWLELKLHGKKVLFGTFYIPPNCEQYIWVKLENSLDMALNDNHVDYIMITGDFNDNQINCANSKIRPLLTQFSLNQLIDEPTHFTEQPSSLLDLFMTNNVNAVTYCGVRPPLLEQLRYHCPIIGLLNFPKTCHKSFKRKIWLYDRGDYTKYRNILSGNKWNSITDSDNIEDMTATITHIILDAADKCIPNKIITVRKDQPPWLTNEIKKKIRKKNRIHKIAKRRNNSKDWNRFKKIRNEVTNLVRKSKEDFNNSLIKKVINNNSSNKNWWKIVNQITGMKSKDTSIPPLLINDSLIFDDIDKANELNDFFLHPSLILMTPAQFYPLYHLMFHLQSTK
ncbi:unnamed protein product [Mytilus coruscus]|uniref:Endonuclease/exonuclease/phosphatase domain-containing protein n=1 Tax=Mytilus coruscus TaxID=42192 RepID=A0A6J7ZUY3_MYTCO|nr:unnamed protein product [Mytilus coruscus]